VSTKEQTENLSLPTQLRACEEYCRREGYEVVERFKEEGESAKTADRTELQKLLKYCRTHNRSRPDHQRPARTSFAGSWLQEQSQDRREDPPASSPAWQRPQFGDAITAYTYIAPKHGRTGAINDAAADKQHIAVHRCAGAGPWRGLFAPARKACQPARDACPDEYLSDTWLHSHPSETVTVRVPR
jgi:hypothetical protein